ncbi:MAG: SRPBCC domain-containing protein [Actinobacteria bacterium]|nr:SRPBCC domain-containing protein [Actinomycetota bacterium]
MSHDLHIERLIDAGPEEVFDAFTDPAAMAEWYRAEDDWTVDAVADARAGGTATVSFGPPESIYREDLTYLEVERPSRLVYSEVFSMPDGDSFETTVSLNFEERGGKTLITLVQTGFPTAEMRDAHEGGWPGFLERIESMLTLRSAS